MAVQKPKAVSASKIQKTKVGVAPSSMLTAKVPKKVVAARTKAKINRNEFKERSTEFSPNKKKTKMLVAKVPQKAVPISMAGEAARDGSGPARRPAVSWTTSKIDPRNQSTTWQTPMKSRPPKAVKARVKNITG